MDTRDMIKELETKIRSLAETKGFGDSYAYQYGYFSSSVSTMLDELLTDKQKKKLAEEIARVK